MSLICCCFLNASGQALGALVKDVIFKITTRMKKVSFCFLTCCFLTARFYNLEDYWKFNIFQRFQRFLLRILLTFTPTTVKTTTKTRKKSLVDCASAALKMQVYILVDIYRCTSLLITLCSVSRDLVRKINDLNFAAS